MTYLRPPRLPGGRSWRRAASVLAIAALAALALAITGSGAALASPASPHAAAAVRAAGAPPRSSTPPPVPRSSTPAPPPKKAKGTQANIIHQYSGPTWMHDIGNYLASRKLSDIVIPGSHDSTTYSLPGPGDDLWHTQDQELKDQLNGGMRVFDIRVEYVPRNPDGSGGDYWAHHGQGITDHLSTWLDLHRIFSDIASWAQTSGHQQEIIKLDLTSDAPSDLPDFKTDETDCGWFGGLMGDALLTPSELQAHFGTTDPGQLTLAQLWSLPDPQNYARVILDDVNDACLQYAHPGAGTWTPSSGYYADQCTALGNDNYMWQSDGIIARVVPAADGRITAGSDPDNPIPTPWGPPWTGGLYELGIQGTPEVGCLRTPSEMVPDEHEVLDVVFDDPTRQRLNVVEGDFVEKIPLFDAAVLTDQDEGSGAPPAPTITYYTGGEGSGNAWAQVTVDFSSTNYGPDPITSYTLTATDPYHPAAPAVTATGPGSPLTVTGLTNGEVYLLTVTATNAEGTSLPSQPGGIRVGVPPKVTGGPAATGIVGQPYSSAFTVTGAPAPTVTLVSGDKPPGLTLGSDGTLIGTPTQAGRYTFTVQASNKLNTADATVTITISGSAPAAPAITGVTLGAGQAGVAFSDASPGTDPITSYTVSATDKNHPAAPPVTATGPASPVTVTGLTDGDPYVFTVTATSAAGTSPPSAGYGPLNVGVAPVIVTGPANGTAGQPYSSGFTVTGAPPPAVTQVSGNRPPGLTLGSDGTLTGTPTQAGSYEFTVQAANPVGTYDATVTVVIAPATLGAGPPPPGGRQLPATICTTPAGHQPACAARTLTGPFPPLGTSAAATLLRGTVTYASGRAAAGYRTLTLSGQRPVPAGSYTLILRHGHHAIIVPVTIR